MNDQLKLIVKKGGRTRRVGGQPQNQNAAKHGFYAFVQRRMLHRGSTYGKKILEIESKLVDALGGDLSPQEEILVERVLSKLLKCWLAEAAMLNGEKPDEAHYLALSNSLRLDLQALGLKRRKAEVPSLTSYLKQKGQAG